MMWGVFWYPLRWFDSIGAGGAWVSLIFNAVAALSALPWMINRAAWHGFSRQLLNGLLLGSAFALYTVSLVMTDVIHAILLFYLTPLWSTLVSWLFLGQRLTASRVIAMVFGFSGMALILGISEGLPVPRNAGDWIALASGMLWAAGTLRSYASPSFRIALPVFTFAVGGIAASGLILLMTEVLVGAITAAMFSGEAFGIADAIGTALIVSAGLVEIVGRR